MIMNYFFVHVQIKVVNTFCGNTSTFNELTLANCDWNSPKPNQSSGK